MGTHSYKEEGDQKGRKREEKRINDSRTPRLPKPQSKDEKGGRCTEKERNQREADFTL